jgi:hypothetical protein
LDLDREANITDRVTQAIAELGAELKNGDPNFEVRLGGIYALEQIARDSPRNHWTIMEILTAYVRRNAQWKQLATPEGAHERRPAESSTSQDLPARRADIQAVLTVLGRRVAPPWPGQGEGEEQPRQDLHETDLRDAYLAGSKLQGANLWGAHLDNADLRDAHLEYAVLWHAHFGTADLFDTHLDGAHLQYADIRNVRNLTQDQLGRAAHKPDEYAPVPPPKSYMS